MAPSTVRKLSTITPLAARKVSWVMRALNSRGPMVSRLMTMATMVSPETMAGRMNDTVLTMGFRAMRTGYLNSSRCSSTPLARAVITYCFCNSSSSTPRITRITPAVPDSPITSRGIGRWVSRSRNLPQLHGANLFSKVNSPPMLRPNHFCAASIRISASRKLGTDTPA